MLASHFGYVSLQEQMGIILPPRADSVAPLRHEAALTRYLEMQKMHRERAQATNDEDYGGLGAGIGSVS